MTALILSGICTSAIALEIPEVTLPLMPAAPVIDGKISAEEWKYAAAMDGSCFNSKKSGELFPAEMQFFVGADSRNLYISVRSEYGPAGLVQKMLPQEGNVDTFNDDSIETIIIPDLTAKQKSIFHSNVNNRGAIYKVGKVNGAIVPFHGRWISKGTVKDGVWEFEMSIPWKDLGIKEGEVPSETGIRICRNWKRYKGGFAQTSWEPFKTEFFSDAKIPVIRWIKDSPVVQVKNIRRYASGQLSPGEMTVFNPGQTPVCGNIAYHFFPENSHDAKLSEDFSIGAKETKRILLPGGPASAREPVTWKLQVTSSDGKTVWYKRDVVIIPEKEKEIFVSGKEDEHKLGFTFAYYPSYGKMLFRVDGSNISDISGLKNLKAVLRLGEKVVAEIRIPEFDARKRSFLEWNTPDFRSMIPEGKDSALFLVELQSNGKTIISQRFECHREFEWENNALGKSDRIVPPFTGVNFENGIVKVLLRDYKLNSLGLPEQVVADGRALLMDKGFRLEIKQDGKTCLAEGILRPEKQGNSFLDTVSRWKAGKLTGSSRVSFDQDGMMLWRLSVDPGFSIDSMRLVIPLDDAVMPLMHSSGDGARINYAGAVPKGEGKIWDASKVVRIGLTDYVPYLWLGDELRGLAVFGDNDRGWATDKNVPEFEIIRNGGKLELILNLAAKPYSFEKGHEIKLGFMASPVKPMPENWRRWNAWAHFASGVNAKMVNEGYFTHTINFLGSGWYFGTVTPCSDVYPRDMDMKVLEKISEARKTKQRPDEWIRDWCEKGPKDKNEKTRLAHLLNGFGRAIAKGGDEVMFYYNPRGARFKTTQEGRHYINEWFRLSAADREVMDDVAYDVDPVESYCDYALFWYKKTLESGAMDQMYWDDLFLAPNFNLVGTDAYLRQDGSIQPVSGVFHMRELIRRSAVMMAEMGRTPRFMLHMTSTNILPILSYGAMNFDWEQNLGGCDFQDRNPREYIRAMSIGRQSGNFPVALVADPTPKEKTHYAHWIRTATGVLLTHEMRWHKEFPEFWNTLKRMFDFGYGKPGVQVRNYWEKDYPVFFPERETSSLLAINGHAAMILVCDWDNGGDCVMELNLKKLPLPQPFRAFNMETGEELKVSGNKIHFPLRKHDYILIELK